MCETRARCLRVRLSNLYLYSEQKEELSGFAVDYSPFPTESSLASKCWIVAFHEACLFFSQKT